jgi:Leucine-rich repeat (LRR) protein
LERTGYLKILTLQNNKIEIIPEEIIKLLNLEVLDLSQNNISLYAYIFIYIIIFLYYIYIIIVFFYIIILHISKFFTMNHSYRIPSYIGTMPNLKQFVIKGNNIKNVRADIIRCGTPRILTHIRQSGISTNINTGELLQSTSNYPDKYVWCVCMYVKKYLVNYQFHFIIYNFNNYQYIIYM